MPGTPQHSELELLQLIAKGDEAAFSSLFNNYRNKIYSIAYELTESTVIAEEIVQDTFLKIWLRKETLEDVTHFKAYLFTITRIFQIAFVLNYVLSGSIIFLLFAARIRKGHKYRSHLVE